MSGVTTEEKAFAERQYDSLIEASSLLYEAIDLLEHDKIGGHRWQVALNVFRRKMRGHEKEQEAILEEAKKRSGNKKCTYLL